MLEIGVHGHDGVAARVGHAGGERDLLAEVARERDHLHGLVLLGEAREHEQRVVAAAVVDEDHLPAIARHGGGHCDERSMHRLDVLRLVEYGHHNAHERRARAGFRRHGREATSARREREFACFEREKSRTSRSPASAQTA